MNWSQAVALRYGRRMMYFLLLVNHLELPPYKWLMIITATMLDEASSDPFWAFTVPSVDLFHCIEYLSDFCNVDQIPHGR